MLTKLTIRNFKRFGAAEIELGNPVVFVGPNNSGKTTALQALALWSTGLRLWNAKRSGKTAPAKRPGVTVNRRDLVAVPVPSAKALWNALHVREVRKAGGRQNTSNVRVDIVVEGVTRGRSWTCGFEFDYANEESFYCRPLRVQAPAEAGSAADGTATADAGADDRAPGGQAQGRMEVPEEAGAVSIAYLPPMSGLAATESRLDSGAVAVRIGEGRTAEVLRNLCYRVHVEAGGEATKWDALAAAVERLFGARIDAPSYVPERGEVTMTYVEDGVRLDLSAAGRGLQQTLLLLAYMYANPGAVLLLDEPDAHLEILRQRETYNLLAQEAAKTGSQIVAATHSEVILNEAAGRGSVIAFVGRRPHPIGGRGSQVATALKDIGWEDYYQAEQRGWVLYLEGSTDLAILQAFARRLAHDRAERALAAPFVRYVGNHPAAAAKHFQGLKEAVPNLRGAALFDRLANLPKIPPVASLSWSRREIENYLCSRATLEAFAKSEAPDDGPLLAPAERQRRARAMTAAIAEMERALATLDKGSPWDADAKVSDDFLVPLFRAYYKKLELRNLMAKRNFHLLAEHVPKAEIDQEVVEKLEAIAETAAQADEALAEPTS